MIYDWLNKYLSGLVGCQDEFFRRLWEDGRLKHGSDFHQPNNALDESCARLVCATISTRSRLLQILPDTKPHRPALLFATALLRCWYDSSQDVPAKASRVLYFGTTIGIREQLAKVRIQGFRENLGEVFQQLDFGRRSASDITTPGISGTNRLPHVITSYAPADSVSVLRQYDPSLVAVDLDDSPKADWLAPLLEEAGSRHVPVVGWGFNPLSESVNIFTKYGRVLSWPLSLRDSNSSSLESQPQTQIHTFVLEGAGAETIASTLKEAMQSLIRATEIATGRLGRDAIRQHFWYLYALQSLYVPYGFYEAEAGQFWGLKTLTHLRTACEHFLTACERTDNTLGRELERSFTLCGEVEKSFHTTDPPLWNGLSNLCIDEPQDSEARLLVFSGRAKKQLFLLSLLAYHNLSESDLMEVRTWVVTVDELRRMSRRRDLNAVNDEVDLHPIDPGLAWRPLLIGVPGENLSTKLLPALLQANVDVLIYPNQVGVLKRRANEWRKSLAIDTIALRALVSDFMSGKPTTTLPPVPPMRERLSINKPVALEASTARRRVSSHVDSLWRVDDPATSVASLLDSEDVEVGDTQGFWEPLHSMQPAEDDAWCDQAITLHFAGGATVTYPADEHINVVVSGPCGPEIDERSVRSLRKGEQVVLIHGQKRQSFYELIISRMHQHPSLVLHLGFIRRWQSDFLTVYHQWSETSGNSPERLLQLMRARGSNLISPETILWWLRGRTLCPQDVEDLRRLSEILRMDFVRENYERIARAATRLRGLHRGVANKLNRWLQQRATDIDSRNDEEIIDKDLGLTFGDLRSSLSLQRILDIELLEGPMLRSSLGRLEIN